MKSSLFSTLLGVALLGLGGCTADERDFSSGAGGAGGSGQGGGGGGGGQECSSPADCPAGDNEAATCSGGQCGVVCNAGFLDCSAEAPGCETNGLAKESCGACGAACATECISGSEGGAGAFCNDPIEISAGYKHTCVIRKDGTLWCWGRNTVGELGIPIGQGAIPVPVLVPLPGKAIKVAAGGGIYSAQQVPLAHTCAILEDTTVYCWGAGVFGQLGIGGSISSDKPVQVTSLVNAVAISAGGAHTCAVKTDGDVYCWGSDADGQLGNGPAQDSPTPVLVLSGAKSVDAGESHTCAVMQPGLQCWGRNFDGQLGTGDTMDRFVPTEVTIPLKMGVEEVAAGDRHTCARKGNEAYCFGNDYNGACAANKWGPVVTPTLVAVPSVTHIAVGRERSGAVSGAMGLVRMWGVAPLGDEGGQPLGTPVEVKISGVSRLAGGYQHTCALKSNGEVWCWGEDSDGQLGNGQELVDEPLPVPVVWGVPK
ncbi:MAG TPA: hypothetical protein VK459_08780 [Polyangiaceae bacterium]|jgi:hypothetical protein|nr:hypothetical protein [Polyangiaceae bacterium]